MSGATNVVLIVAVLVGVCSANSTAKGNASLGSERLVARVLDNCADVGCVKFEVLKYLDNLLKIDETRTSRSVKNIDQAIFKRASRVMNSNEFKFSLPELIFGGIQMIYNPISGLDVLPSLNSPNGDEGRGILKKKLLLPILLLLKLKMKALMPLFVLIAKIKAVKALILSKLAIGVVIAFIIYQMMNKSGMPMPMSMTMAPIEPPPLPPSMYGPPPHSPPLNSYGPPPATAPPNSYEPSWEPSPPGPYARIWTESSGGSSNINGGGAGAAYSAYYPGSSSVHSGNGLGSTSRPSL